MDGPTLQPRSSRAGGGSRCNDLAPAGGSAIWGRCRDLDPHEAFLPGLIDEKDDITLEEMRARLRDEHGLTVGLDTLWSFLDARDLSYKKDSPRRRARAAGCEGCARGLVRGPARSRSDPPRVPRRDVDLHQHGPHTRALSARQAAALARAARPLEDYDPRRRPAPVRDRRTLRARWADQPRRLPGLRRSRASARWT